MTRMKNAAQKSLTQDFDFELKGVDDDGTFEGYGAIFGNVDFGGDVIERGAFADTIKALEKSKRKLPVLWQHDSYSPIGVYDELKEDERGLFVKGRLFKADVQKAREAYALLRGSAITGMSIGYGARSFKRDETTGIRTLKQVDLFEISLVTFPMNDAARVDNVKQKIIDGELPSEREFEKFLREAGFSKQNATAIAGHGIRGLLRDAGGTKSSENEVLSVLQGFKI